MTTTHHLGITLVETAQAQKEVTVNAAISRIDAILNTGAKDKDLIAPPGSPAAGDVYIVGAAATGDWAGKDGQVAWFDQVWKFLAPNEGMTLWVNDENLLYTYDGAAWKAVTAGRKLHYIPARLISPTVVAGCGTLTNITTTAGQPDVVALPFDAISLETACFSFRMPKSWNEGTVTAIFEWSHPATATNFGVVWGIQAVAIGDGEPLQVSYGTQRESADTGGNTHYLYKSPETSAITIAGTPQENDTVFFQIYRNTGHGSDNMAVDAYLHGVALFYTTHAGTDD